MGPRILHGSLIVLFLSLLASCSGDAPAGVRPAQDPQVAGEVARQWLDRTGTADRAELTVARVQRDRLGMAHVRVDQHLHGVPVFGAQGIVHVGPDGVVRSFTDGLVPDARVDTTPLVGEDDAVARAIALHSGEVDDVRADLQVLRHEGVDHLVWRVQIDDLLGPEPSRPVIFVDAHTGAEVFRYDNLQTARSRETYSANNTYNLPGLLQRAELDPAVGDLPVDDAHDFAGVTWDYYDQEQGRDSFDDAGATMISTAHYAVGFDNAYWDSTEVVFGDGAIYFLPLSQSIEVVAHEWTHGVTEHSAGLVYSGESGGLNEATSDIMGATVQSFAAGWLVDDTTWMIGDEITLPAYGDALRYMNDPPLDGVSVDNYADYTPYLDVHYSSGIANKAFYLMATDPSLGIQASADLWYRALTLYMTPSTTFADARAATVLATTDLYGAGTAQVDAVNLAWDGVGVYDFVVFDTQTPLRGLARTMTFYAFVTPVDATAVRFALSGGTGNVDLYVNFGSNPSQTDIDCSDSGRGNTETCILAPAQQGTYYVGVRGVKKYQNVTLTASSAGP